MPGFYLDLKNNDYRLPARIPDDADKGVGAVLMDTFTQKHWTWPGNAAQILDTFYNHMETFWTWYPPTATGGGEALLDGRIMSGFCGQLAQAFTALLRAPHPYGFGVQTARTVQYEAEGQAHMFVANHPGPVFGLKANVLRHDWETNGRAFRPFYAWGNHTVVQTRDGGPYYDPCYNAIYNALRDMARHQVTLQTSIVAKKMVVLTATAHNPTGGVYTFTNVQENSPARRRHPLASLIAPENLPA